MRVRYLGDKKAFTAGREYVVLSIVAHAERGVQLMVLDDELHRPAWLSSGDFDLSSDEVPSNWHIQIGGAASPGHLKVGPASWLEPGFLDNYWGDGGPETAAAQDAFDRELEVILRES